MSFGSAIKFSLIILVIVRRANVQIAYPMFMQPPPMIAMPPPMHIPVFAIEIPEATTTTTTTTTTEKRVALAVPVPVPMSVVPAYAPAFCVANPRPKGCPACPPCSCMPQCTPAFFSYCSPCHLKCRCRNPGDAPIPLSPSVPVPGPAYPMPIPLPAGPPVVIVPMPPQILPQPRRRPRPKSSSSEESSDSSDCDSLRRGSKFKRRKLKKFRRRGSSESENEMVKPLLTYVSNNGEVKYEEKISNDEADQLLGRSDGRRYNNVRVITRTDEANKQQVVVMSNDDNTLRPHPRYKQVMLRNGASSHVLSSGRKELVFKPPDDKIISNLSVSFQIA